MASTGSLSGSLISKNSNIDLPDSSLIVAQESVAFCICHSSMFWILEYLQEYFYPMLHLVLRKRISEKSPNANNRLL